jgi:hypothetical protein
LRCLRGNNLTEYALPLALVAFVALGAGMLLQSGLTGTMTSQYGGTRLNPASKTLQIQQMGMDPSVMPLTVRLANGQVLTLDGYPQDISKSVETVGINGTTEKLRAVLESLIVQLEQGPNPDPDTINTLHALANTAHNMAELQRLLEDAAQRAGNDKEALARMTFTLNDPSGPVTLTTRQVAARLGFIFDNYDTSVLSDYPQLVPYLKSSNVIRQIHGDKTAAILEKDPPGMYLANLLEQFRTLDQGGRLNDPTLRQVVTTLTSQIMHLSDTFEGNVIFSTDPTVPDQRPSQIQQATASNITNLKAATICTVGGTKDSGVFCPATQSS